MPDYTRVITPEGIVDVPFSPTEGLKVMQWIGEHGNPRMKGCVFEGITVSGLIVCLYEDTVWRDCIFEEDADFSVSAFINCLFDSCEFKNPDTIEGKSGVINKNPIMKLVELDSIKQMLGAKQVVALPNKMFVKVSKECDFCHHVITNIVHRQKPRHWMKKVPNIDRYVCDNCYRMYDLQHKEGSSRTYGYHGPVSRFRTPMDKQHTAILGLEMEFEGDFHGWKALEDAHQGRAFYGYDSSVRGQNELSWDCGSYSWWKHLSPLKEVCRALRDGGAEEGPTAGIHIHVSRDDVDTNMIAEKINGWCRSGTMRTLMDAISLRSDRERYDRYANLSESAGTHHAGISRSPHRTCEFRIFASSLDEKTILLRLKFCKELFEMAVENVPKSAVMRGFSKRVKEHIIECAKKQADTGFISGSDRDKLLKDLA